MIRTSVVATSIAVLALAGMSMIWGTRAEAQTGRPSVGASLFLFQVPPYPDQWSSTPSFARLAVYNGGQEAVGATVTVRLIRAGTSVATAPSMSLTFPPGVATYTASQFALWDQMRFTGTTAEAVQRTSRIPEGPFDLCVELTQMRGLSSGVQISDTTTCSGFVVKFPKPSRLLLPRDGAANLSPYPVFQWTPVAAPGIRSVGYFFRVVEILPHQLPLQAIEANYPVFEVIVPGTTLPYPASAALLRPGGRYAWRIQALTSVPSLSTREQVLVNWIPLGENDGWSPVSTFIHRGSLSEGLGSGSAASYLGLDFPDEDPRASSSGNGPDNRNERARSDLDGAQGPRKRTELTPADGDVFDGLRDRSELASDPVVAHESGHRTELAPSDHDARDGSSLALLAMAGTREAERPAGKPSAGQPESLFVPRSEGVPGARSGPKPRERRTRSGSRDSTGEAETTTPQESGVGGTLASSGEVYERAGSGPENRPPNTGRVLADLHFNLMGGRLSVPVTGVVSSDQRKLSQSINQVGVSPTYKWTTLYSGHFTPHYGGFTLADATLLGGGAELQPGPWRVGFASGRARKAVVAAPGAANAQFERNMIGGLVGYHWKEGDFVELSSLRAGDEESSLEPAFRPTLSQPQQSTALALRGGRSVASGAVKLGVELGHSTFKHDVRTGSRVNANAVALNAAWAGSGSSIDGTVEYVEPGFTTLGNSGLVNDRLEVALNARTQVLADRLLLGGGGGWREDNLKGDLSATTRNWSTSVDASWRPAGLFQLDFNAVNNVNDSNAEDSTAESSRSTSRQVSIGPQFGWITGRLAHLITGMASLQTSDNSSSVIALSDFKTLTLLGNYALTLPIPLVPGVAVTYTRNEVDTLRSTVISVVPSLSYAILGGKLRAYGQMQLIWSRANAPADRERTPSFQLGYALTRQHRVVLNATFRHYRHADGRDFHEQSVTLGYSANLN